MNHKGNWLDVHFLDKFWMNKEKFTRARCWTCDLRIETICVNTKSMFFMFYKTLQDSNILSMLH